VIATQALRELDTPRLDSLFRDRAYSGGIDWVHRWEKNRYTFNGRAGWSLIHGSQPVITAAQRSSARYYQRPDQDYVRLDSTRTSLSGYSSEATVSYFGPSGWGWAVNGMATSPGFELNDLGFLTRADDRAAFAWVGWSLPRPGKRFRSYGGSASTFHRWNAGGTRLGRSVSASAYASLQSGWGASMYANYEPRGLNQTATRGGPLLLTGEEVGGGLFTYSDSRKRISGNTSLNLYRDEFGGRSVYTSLSLTWRPSTVTSFSLGPNYSVSRSPAFFAAAISDTLADATFDRRYVFATLVQRNLGITTRANVTFTPALSLQIYMQPFTAAGRYSGFKELLRPRSFDFHLYTGDEITRDPSTGNYTVDPDGPGGPASSFTVFNPDVSFSSLRGTAVLRWEYLPGSTLFAVWTQSRSDFDRTGAFGGLGDVRDIFSLPPRNIFLIKASYWFSR
jgi:hypothetical protein